jgi:hypothetical protein
MKRRVLIVIMVAILLMAYVLILRILVHDPSIDRSRPPTVQLTLSEKRYFEERFRYHGISGCICEGDACWFIRDGKRCRL